MRKKRNKQIFLATQKKRENEALPRAANVCTFLQLIVKNYSFELIIIELLSINLLAINVSHLFNYDRSSRVNNVDVNFQLLF